MCLSEGYGFVLVIYFERTDFKVMTVKNQFLHKGANFDFSYL